MVTIYPGNILSVVMALAVAFALGVVIALVYRWTHKGLSYSQSFIVTLTLFPTILAGVMMIIGSNLAIAFGLVGALSVIRFRTVVKDTKDTAFLFLTLGVGMAIGTGNFIIGGALTLAVCIFVLILSSTNFGSVTRSDHVLTFQIPGGDDDDVDYAAVLKRHTRDATLLRLNSLQEGAATELIFNIKLKKVDDATTMVRELEALPGTSHIGLLTAKHDLEY